MFSERRFVHIKLLQSTYILGTGAPTELMLLRGSGVLQHALRMDLQLNVGSDCHMSQITEVLKWHKLKKKKKNELIIYNVSHIRSVPFKGFYPECCE